MTLNNRDKGQLIITQDLIGEISDIFWHARKDNCIKSSNNDIIYRWKPSSLTRGEAEEKIKSSEIDWTSLIILISGELILATALFSVIFNLIKL